MSLLSIQGLTKRFGGLLVTDQLDLTIEPGELHALIGPNGAGKTTLMQQLSGNIRSDSGSIVFDGKDITSLPSYRRARRGIARAYQITSAFPDLTVLENVALSVNGVRDHSFSFWRRMVGEANLVGPAAQIIGQLGLNNVANRPACDLSHGDRRQLEIAMALAMDPKLLLLDEPLAGLSAAEAHHVVALLRSLKARYTILLVEHDMDAVFNLADRITVLQYGRMLASGTPGEIREHADVRAAYLGEQEDEGL